MLGEHHDIPTEFPEYREVIDDLYEKDHEFKKMYIEYHALDKEVRHIEQNLHGVSDFYAEDLKKKRALLKDKIYLTLKQQSG